MRFLGVQGDRFLFQLGRREKRLLFEVLRHYPLVPGSYHRLSRTADPERGAADQALLEESIAAHKAERREQLRRFLAEEDRFAARRDGYGFWLRPGEVEWLLEILNDIRVGNWVRLGCPDPKQGRPLALTPENAGHYLAMEFCGYLESMLLEALR